MINHRKLTFERVLENLRNGKYRGKIQAIDYANTGIQPFEWRKFCMQLGISYSDAKEMGLILVTNQSGWNLPREPTPEELSSFKERLSGFNQGQEIIGKKTDKAVAPDTQSPQNKNTQKVSIPETFLNKTGGTGSADNNLCENCGKTKDKHIYSVLRKEKGINKGKIKARFYWCYEDKKTFEEFKPAQKPKLK